MCAYPIRRSDRVAITLPITVSGSDPGGNPFLAQGQTSVVARHGAQIVLQMELAPGQEILIRCLVTGKEAHAHITAMTGFGPNGQISYGIELVGAGRNIWDIEFPPIAEGEGAAGRVVLECAQCGLRELAYLTDFQAEALGMGKGLTRYCRQCSAQSHWDEFRPGPTESAAHAADQLVAPSPASLPRGVEDRRDPRQEAKVTVCVRHPQMGEVIAETVNISRGGFRFRSKKPYSEGDVIEAALPFSPAGANIFVPGRIVYAAKIPGSDLHVCGVMYLPAKQRKSDRS
jgi:hypothetical protein